MFMHNMPMFMHNMPSCTTCHHACTIYHHVCTTYCMDNMRYAHTTCQHAQYTNMRYAVQHAVMQAQYACAKCMRTTATWHSPKIKVHDEPTRGFPSTRGSSWKGLLKLLRSQALLETNIRDRWQNHSQPAKGPGVCCKVVQTFGSSQGLQT